MSSKQGLRNREEVLRNLLLYVDDEGWFARSDFETAAHRAGIVDRRTIWGHPKQRDGYWNILQDLEVIESVALRDGVVMGRLSRATLEHLEAEAETRSSAPQVQVDVRIMGRGRKREQLVSPEAML